MLPCPYAQSHLITSSQVLLAVRKIITTQKHPTVDSSKAYCQIHLFCKLTENMCFPQS
jgi:hypothetical protein